MNDLDPVDIATRNHYLKESAKEDDTDYAAKACEILDDLDTFSEVFPSLSEGMILRLHNFYQGTTFGEDSTDDALIEEIYAEALKYVGGS